MDKQAYLDAMGISRWVRQEMQLNPCVILHDQGVQLNLEHPIVTSVLALLEVDVKQVVTSYNGAKLSQVCWDMRSVKRPQIDTLISSAPIAVLEQQSSAKQALWQSICQREISDA
ncbi:hypothetical protein [Shewanella colwelliana]|uniref:hypothetical protein n=1 Tax=Shewanella colwelliana TaxID=23 RepID=UPI00048AD139|nr:hypothetical protein [Shewanella colwelliana]MDX1282950.1 hypothetical protein [Shewanella colwelliana]